MGHLQVVGGVKKDLGCNKCTSGGNCDRTFSIASSGTQTKNPDLPFQVYMKAWETDRSDSNWCNYKSSVDDALREKTCTFEMTDYSMGNTHTVRCDKSGTFLETQFRCHLHRHQHHRPLHGLSRHNTPTKLCISHAFPSAWPNSINGSKCSRLRKQRLYTRTLQDENQTYVSPT